MTIFVDFQSRRILHAVEGREKQVLEPFLKKLARKAKKLKAEYPGRSGEILDYLNPAIRHHKTLITIYILS